MSPKLSIGVLETRHDAKLKQLADKLKKRFPKLPIYLLGDSLYGCELVFRICRQKRWSYIVVFKKGRTPSLWKDARRKCRRRPDHKNVQTLTNKGGRQRWKIENQGFNTS